MLWNGLSATGRGAGRRRTALIRTDDDHQRFDRAQMRNPRPSWNSSTPRARVIAGPCNGWSLGASTWEAPTTTTGPRCTWLPPKVTNTSSSTLSTTALTCPRVIAGEGPRWRMPGDTVTSGSASCSKAAVRQHRWCPASPSTAASSPGPPQRRAPQIPRHIRGTPPEFEDADEEVTETLEREATRRASKGTLKPVFYQGKVCGEIREYSDTLLIFLQLERLWEYTYEAAARRFFRNWVRSLRWQRLPAERVIVALELEGRRRRHGSRPPQRSRRTSLRSRCPRSAFSVDGSEQRGADVGRLGRDSGRRRAPMQNAADGQPT